MRSRGAGRGGAPLALAAAVAVLGLIERPACAGLVLTGAGGWFEPWDGSGGFSVLGQALASLAHDGRFRVGGEFEYHRYETELFGASDIRMETFALRGIFNYVLLPSAPVRPYVGAGLGTEFQHIDSHEIEKQKGDDKVQSFGSGLSILGILGVEVPLGQHLSVFAEGRLGYSMLVTIFKDTHDPAVEYTGGAHGLGGLRIRF